MSVKAVNTPIHNSPQSPQASPPGTPPKDAPEGRETPEVRRALPPMVIEDPSAAQPRVNTIVQMSLGGQAGQPSAPEALADFAGREIDQLDLNYVVEAAGIPASVSKPMIKHLLRDFKEGEHLQLLFRGRGAACMPSEIYNGFLQVNREIDTNETEIRRLSALTNLHCCQVSKVKLRYGVITGLALGALALLIMQRIDPELAQTVITVIVSAMLLSPIVSQAAKGCEERERAALARTQTEQSKLRERRQDLITQLETHCADLSTALCYDLVDRTPYRLRGSRNDDLAYLFSPDATRVALFDAQEKLLVFAAKRFRIQQTEWLRCIDELVSRHAQSATPAQSHSSNANGDTEFVQPIVEAVALPTLARKLCKNLTDTVAFITLDAADPDALRNLSHIAMKVSSIRLYQEQALDNIREHFVKGRPGAPILKNPEAQTLRHMFRYSVGALADGRVHANAGPHQRKVSAVATSSSLTVSGSPTRRGSSARPADRSGADRKDGKQSDKGDKSDKKANGTD